MGSDSTGKWDDLTFEDLRTSSGITWGWGEHCWHTWKEYPLFTSVEIRCSKCGKLKEKDDESPEEARQG